MNLEITKINELVHPEKNVRDHSDKQLVELYRSYKMFGQIRPVVIDENNVILAGNGLIMALKHYGVEEVKVLRYTDLSEDMKIKLMIADNRVFTIGTDNVLSTMDLLKDLGDFDVPGYDSDFLETLLAADFDSVIESEAVEDYGIIEDEDVKEQFTVSKERLEDKINKEKETPTVTKISTRTVTITCPECGEIIEIRV